MGKRGTPFGRKTEKGNKSGPNLKNGYAKGDPKLKLAPKIVEFAGSLVDLGDNRCRRPRGGSGCTRKATEALDNDYK